MADRLEEIRAQVEHARLLRGDDVVPILNDVAWLLAEIDRLRKQQDGLVAPNRCQVFSDAGQCDEPAAEVLVYENPNMPPLPVCNEHMGWHLDV